VTPTEYLEHIRRDGERLAEAARNGLDAQVPACPDWTVRDLVAHTGEVHRQKALLVARRIQDHPREAFGEFASELPDLELEAPDGADVIAWYEAGLGILLEALGSADPADKVWTWYEPQQDVAFWYRRMAHETAIHRVDAEQAHGIQTSIPVDLAVDGLDEVLDWNLRWGVEEEDIVHGSGETIHVHAHDADGEWMLTLQPDRIDLERGHGKGDAALRGSAEDLDLYLWGRRPLDGLEVIGDRALVERLRELAALATQ